MNAFDLVSIPERAYEFALILFFSALKASVLLGSIYFISRIFRQTSAALRHFVLITALFAGLLLPFVPLDKAWGIPVLPVQVTGIQSPTLPAIDTSEVQIEGVAFPEMAPVPATISAWLVAIWKGIALFLLLRLVAGNVLANLRARQAKAVDDPHLLELATGVSRNIDLKTDVKLLLSKKILTPVTCGLWRSKILLPESFASWPEERQRVVLLHEIAHVKRRDCLTQMLAQVACAVYWFNPLVWHIARYLRELREQACDDQVLNAGTVSSVYADHLLEIARSIRQKRPTFDLTGTATIAIARRSQVETRLISILDARKSRRASNHLIKAAAILAVALFALPLSALQLRSQPDDLASVSEISSAGDREQLILNEPPGSPESAGSVSTKNQNTPVKNAAKADRRGFPHKKPVVRLTPLDPLQESLGSLRGDLAPLKNE